MKCTVVGTFILHLFSTGGYKIKITGSERECHYCKERLFYILGMCYTWIIVRYFP